MKINVEKIKFKSKIHLWIYFAMIVFMIMLVSAVLIMILAIFLLQNELIDIHKRGPEFPIFMLLLVSVIVGTIIACYVGVKILRPINELSIASRKVAKGDFSVRLNEHGFLDEVREMSKNFNLMVSELSSIETLRNDFVVNVSHEFKTPIATIEGYATLLQEENLSEEEKKEYVNMILESTRQLSSLSGNILNLSKLESQEIILDENNFRLDEQIRQAILLQEKEWSTKNIQMEIDLSKIDYKGDEALLMQVWMNLLSNAIKFTQDEGTISVQSFIKDGTVKVEISDTGCGVEESTVKRIFDKFYQGDTSRKSQGNGLGLSLTKRILDLTGGTVEVESKVDEGSRFTVSLP